MYGYNENLALLGKKEKVVNTQHTTPSKSGKDIYKIVFGYFVGVVAMLLNCAGLVTTQLLGSAVSVFQQNAMRNAVYVAIVIMIIAHKREQHRFCKSQWSVLGLILLSVIHPIQDAAIFFATAFIPVSSISGISGCITVVAHLCFTLLRNLDRKGQACFAAVLAVLGVVAITQPQFMFKENQDNRTSLAWTPPCSDCSVSQTILNNSSQILGIEQNKYVSQGNFSLQEPNTIINLSQDNSNANTGKEWIGYTLVVVNGLGVTIRNEIICNLVHYIDTVTLNLLISLGSTLFFLICTLAFETPVLPTSLPCVLFLVMNMCAQSTLLVPFCLQYMSGATFNLIKSTRMVIIYILQIVFAGVVKPGLGNWMEGVGAALVFCAGIAGPLGQLWYEHKVALRAEI